MRFCPLGDIWQSGDIFGCHMVGMGDATAEATGAGKHPAMHDSPPHTTKSYPAQNVHGGESEKPYSTESTRKQESRVALGNPVEV